MSDKPGTTEMLNQGAEGDARQDGDRHEAARHMAEAALRAEMAGDSAQAEALLSQAERTDPDAVIEVVSEQSDMPVPLAEDDTELSVESETVHPGSDSPSRAGITGSGSGADNQGL